ncbi:hypothetical protein CcaverHIS002_0208690 [Cutaneotrichosporon cavernicola]|uniref:DHHA2 domain-containing protein n=1 Tax=Cutaneotrichosporon cavernicola TaxID=279322 RepID=A0AA48IIL9_9TREE|nr:uncharacterized protein CcaverHIS019_0208700 [Cutaneotrichosporon cavernicola]BEI81709.1 hypothetical protein CcaverHIS002_0208690 [Cutaneotrichosporon cavernicola]BEI89508.1 hypothetical protein CcaverHIS019_0208700 [Cutaneotrichosporon cavernicola]BEI97281.1 hypothetical protein CcaverHIS631_0208700 [Cutaneotrichosporon cavernicola]BEJ05055.1 hypothetical protein CcaverHIS641_0208720 [Cutaneotrichosporon cavernicola]
MPSGSVVPGRLADWLVSQKEAFLADLKAGRGKGWIVSVGNEAGDLDTMASSVSYAFLASTLQAQRIVPVLLTPKKYMHLRPENLLALDQSSIPADVLLHIEDLAVKACDLISAGVEFALVDHNRLLPDFGTGDAAYSCVKSILDHHEDEGVSLSASPRVIVVPNGSSTSLVTLNFKDAWAASMSGPAGVAGSPVPPEIATLLLSALMIDTQGLKPNGKAMPRDIEAAEFLYPLSSLPTVGATAAVGATGGNLPTPLDTFTKELITTKFDISHLGEHDLLVRDYKEYLWDTSSKTSPHLSVGLCTVPVKLEHVLKREKGWANFMTIADEYMDEQKLDVLGITTSWKNSRGKGRRELLLAVRGGGALPDLAAASRVLDALTAGLEGDTETFALEAWKYKDESLAPPSALLNSPARVARVWRQGNHRSTRKQIAPAMHRIVSALT